MMSMRFRSLFKRVFLGKKPQTPPVLEMPLKQSLHSDVFKPPFEAPKPAFLAGENIQVMARSIVSADSRIGSNSYIGYNCCVTRTEIGHYVSIANNCTLGPGEHPLDAVSTSSLFYENAWETLTARPLTIGHDTWIAEGCIIRRGVSIGIGAAIGANSFVNADVPAFAIVAGSPAKVIRMRFSPEQIAMILTSQWWLLPLDQAKIKVAQLEAAFKAMKGLE
jgi:acetyltransferase-like isoleucine patch superfamily enzyme